MQDFKNKTWFQALSHSQQDLVSQAYILLDQEQADLNDYHDFSFIVFPMAKAYEGFLKQFFLDLGIISQKQFTSTHFRIGKSLNPDLPARYRRSDWIVDRLDQTCPILPSEYVGTKLSRHLWKTWKKYRNRLFHFFPEHANFISLKDAETGLHHLTEMMSLAESYRPQIKPRSDSVQ